MVLRVPAQVIYLNIYATYSHMGFILPSHIPLSREKDERERHLQFQ